MSKMIDKDEAIEILCDGCNANCGVPYTACITVQKIIDMPTVEAEPVKHGRWIFREKVEPDFLPCNMWCSCCGKWHDTDDINDNYCRLCGAKMDGGE